jgi:hypothetical protein
MVRVPALCLLAAAAACGLPEGDVPVADHEIADFDLTGGATAHRPGVVQITIPGDPQVRTGLLVSPTLVMASKRWFPAGTVAANLRVRHGLAPGAPERPGWALTVNAQMPMAFIQVYEPFPSAPAVTYGTRDPAARVSLQLTCYGFDSSTTFGASRQNVVTVDGEREVLAVASGLTSADAGPTAVALEDHDAGAPCFDAAGVLAGFVMETRGTNLSYRARIFDMFDSRWYLDNMLRVARLRALPGTPSRGYRIETQVAPSAPMCMDVAWGNPYSGVAVNAFPCNDGNNQRWFLDYSNPNGAAFVNAHTGTCLDVPGASTSADTKLLAGNCNNAANQAFAQMWQGTLTARHVPLDYRFLPARPWLCLVPEAGASTQSSRIEQERCTNLPSPYERWSFVP